MVEPAASAPPPPAAGPIRITLTPHGDLGRVLARGQRSLTVELPPGATVATLFERLGFGLDEVWLIRHNREIVKREQPLADGDTLEVFAVVSGG